MQPVGIEKEYFSPQSVTDPLTNPLGRHTLPAESEGCDAIVACLAG
jgi:hypothetical protein